MPGLPKTAVSWPITGGIATKNAPIMLAPPGHLVLDDVRQERLHEWRTRSGNGQSSVDDLPGLNPPVIATEAPWGGLLALTRETGTTTSGRSYNPVSAPRWVTPTSFHGAFFPNFEMCNQISPGIWARTPISPTRGTVPWMSSAEGGGYRLTSWGTADGQGIAVSLTTIAGAALSFNPSFDALGIRPRCVYCSAANMLVLIYTDATGNIIAQRYSTTSGLLFGTPTTISTNGKHTSGCYLDAIYYGGATVTIAFRDNTGTGGLRIIEYNPASGANTFTEYTPGQNCANTLALMPDPDASGLRIVAVGSDVPEVRVLRLNNVGVIQTNHLADTVDPTNIVGVAYDAGVDWLIVYGPLTAGQVLTAVRRRGGVTTAPMLLGPATSANAKFTLMSGAWREAGVDAMRYMLRSDGATSGDPQATYLEMALDFDQVQNVIVNRWAEPQARLLPLNSYSGNPERGALQQVQRTALDHFVTCFARQTAFDVPADASAGATFAIDAWSVQYMNANTYTGQNQGQGCQTQQCAYLPVGSLLQSATGQMPCSHGASARPFQPTAVASNGGGGGLTAGKAYALVTTTTLYDEEGNSWQSDQSIQARVTAAAMAGNNQITWTATHTPLENSARRRTVKFWRTVGDGSTFFLVHEVTDTIANTISIAWLDTIADTQLAQALSAEVQGTVTPALSHIVMWNRRLWGIDRDFPTRVRFSKPIQAGISPQFPASFVIETDDGFGPCTGIAAMDDRVVLMKSRAIYVAGGDGPDNAGNGSYPIFTRISSDTGNIAGGPFLSTASEVYVTSQGGIFRVTRAQQIDFVGAPIDLYLSMPLLAFEETVLGMVYSPPKNEVRVQTTHYRFVHDRIFNIWVRDTGGFGSGTIVMTKMLGGVTQAFLTNDGHMWIESADSGSPTDPGATFQGIIRSPWIRAAGAGGWLRLYKARAIATVTAGGVVTGAEMRVFFDDDDAVSEGSAPSGNIGAVPGLIRAEARTVRQKCTSFSLQLKLPMNDATVRLENWWVSVAAKAGLPPPAQADRWVPV